MTALSVEEPSKELDAMPGLSSPYPGSRRSLLLPPGANQRKYPQEDDLSGLAGPQLLWKVQNRQDQHPLKLYHPYDVKFLDSEVIVVEGFWPYSRIQIFNNQGKSLRKFAQGQVLPFGVTLVPHGHLAVTDHRERTVKLFTQEGQPWASWPADMFSWPNGIVTDAQDQLIVADWSAGRLSIHTVEGQLVRTIRTSCDSSNASGSCPQYVAVDAHHRILVTDSYDHSVKVFDSQGQLLRRLGHEDAGPGRIADPRGVIADPRGNIVVCDWGGNRVKLFSSDGEFIQDYLTPEHVQNPWGLDCNEQGLLALTEQKLNASPSLKMFA